MNDDHAPAPELDNSAIVDKNEMRGWGQRSSINDDNSTLRKLKTREAPIAYTREPDDYQEVGWFNFDVVARSDRGAVLKGDRRNNKLQGGDGADELDGGQGNDELYGGYGRGDKFIFRNGDGDDFVQDRAGGRNIFWFLQDFKGTYTLERSQHDSSNLYIRYGNRDRIKVYDFYSDKYTAAAEGAEIQFNGCVKIRFSDAYNWTLHLSAKASWKKLGADLQIQDGEGKFIIKDFHLHASNSAMRLPFRQLTFNGITKSVLEIASALEDAGSLVGGDNWYQLSDFFRKGFLVDYSSKKTIGNYQENTIEGDACPNTMYGLKGNDTLKGGAGDDTMYGGDDDDTMYGGDGHDSVFGGQGNDVIYGDAGNDFLYGEDGQDRLFGEDGDDTIFGGSGNDTLFGRAGKDILHGDDGDDLLYGGVGNDKLYGEGNNDCLEGNGGDDYLSGGVGNDTYVFRNGDGQDTIEDSYGEDTISFEQTFEANRYEFERSKNDLVIVYGNGDKIVYKGHWGTNMVDSILFRGEKQIKIQWPNTWILPLSDSATFQEKSNDLCITDGTGSFVFKNVFTNSDVTQVCSQLKIGNTVKTIRQIANALREAKTLLGADKSYQVSSFFSAENFLVEKDLQNIKILIGTDQAQSLGGDASANVIYGLKGDDTLKGEAGNDTYVFRNGDGQDTIEDSSGTDTISFDQSFQGNSYQLACSADGKDLLISYGPTDQITVKDHFATAASARPVENIVLKGGVSIKLGEVVGEWSVIGFSALATFQKQGNNLVISDGTGQFVLKDVFDATKGQVCTQLKFEVGGVTGIKALSSIGTLLNQAATLTTADRAYQLADFLEKDWLVYKLAGVVQDIIGSEEGDNNDQVPSKVLRGNTQNNMIHGLAGHDELFGESGHDELFGGAGNDKMDGGIGNDKLYGGTGDDTYVFGSSQNREEDIIEDVGGNADFIQFKNERTHVLSDDIKKIARKNNDLIVYHGASDSIITIKNHFQKDQSIEYIRASTGSKYPIWDLVRQAEDLKRVAMGSHFKMSDLSNWAFAIADLTADLLPSKRVVYEATKPSVNGEASVSIDWAALKEGLSTATADSLVVWKKKAKAAIDADIKSNKYVKAIGDSAKRALDEIKVGEAESAIQTKFENALKNAIDVVNTIDCSQYQLPTDPARQASDGLYIDLAEGRGLYHIKRDKPLSDPTNKPVADPETQRLLRQIRNVIATSGDDIPRGDAHANTIVGRGGKDSFKGGKGNDRLVDGIMNSLGSGDDSFYEFMTGDGHDEIWDWGGNHDIIQLQKERQNNDISFLRDADDLIVKYNFRKDSNDSIRVHGHFKIGREIEYLKWDNKQYNLVGLTANSLVDFASEQYYTSDNLSEWLYTPPKP